MGIPAGGEADFAVSFKGIKADLDQFILKPDKAQYSLSTAKRSGKDLAGSSMKTKT